MDENIKLKDLCEFIIVSMNGSNTSWGKYIIEDFDLDKCNNAIKNV